MHGLLFRVKIGVFIFSTVHFTDSRIRITRNPIPANYMEAHDSIQNVSTFEEPDQQSPPPHIMPHVRVTSGRSNVYK